MMRYRTLLGLALLVGTLHAQAQHAESHYYSTTEPLDLVRLKFVTEAMRDIDPGALVTHSDDMRILHVRANTAVSDAEIRAAIARTTVAVAPGTPDMRAYLPPPDPDAPPVYMVSGNDAEDLRRYQQAAADWNSRHPERAVAVEPLHLQNR